MSLPKEVNILGTIYTIEVCDLGAKLDGITEPSERRIQINSRSNAHNQVETFYHELVHAMLAHLGLSNLLKKNKEEAIAQGLGMALAYVITANELPKLEEAE